MDEPRFKRQVPGTIIGRWTNTAQALIALEDGRHVEAAGGSRLHALAETGDGAVVYFDRDDKVIGWMLVKHNLGVNYELGTDDS